MMIFFFFFQAEDGIRDHCVTGVQTCALPILRFGDEQLSYAELDQRSNQLAHYLRARGAGRGTLVSVCMERSVEMRSEERRVGKECRSRGAREQEKKKREKGREWAVSETYEVR